MPKLTGLLLVPERSLSPQEITIHWPNKGNYMEAIRALLGINNAPAVENCDLGVMYSSSDKKLEENSIATYIRRKSSRKMPKEHTTVYGRSFILQDDKGNPATLEKSNMDKMYDMWEEMTGCRIKGRKHKQEGPKRAKLPQNFFSRDFIKEKKAELRSQGKEYKFQEITKAAHETWNKLSTEEKQPYIEMAKLDKLRYEKENHEWLEKNPPKPKNKRSAYSLFCSDHPDSKTRPNWKELDEKEKQVYKERAEQDAKRYAEELEKFRTHCDQAGKDFEALTARKKRKRAENDDEEESKSSKRKTKPAKEKEPKEPSKKKSKEKTSKKKDLMEVDGNVDDA